MKSLELSLFFSIFIQLISLLLNIFALYINKSKPFINQLLSLELFVQIIEGSFYIYWYNNFTDIKNITPFRYIDWTISTPSMLITLILFISNSDSDVNLSLLQMIFNDFSLISIVLILNWLMLLFGFLGETKRIPIHLSVFLGFIPFVIYFFIIYKDVVKVYNRGYGLFYYFLFFWSLYGVAAIFPYNIKNSAYNILDLFSKNFFIFYLFYQILV